MPVRRPLLLATLMLLACAGAQRSRALRDQLDQYTLPKPLAEAWPEALRYIASRGYDLVGRDRVYQGQEAQGGIAKFFSKGYETQAVAANHWAAETAANYNRQRYRVEGIGTGPSGCRIHFYAITGGEMGSGPDEPDREYRDVQLELDFIERYDPSGAEKITEAARTAAR